MSIIQQNEEHVPETRIKILQIHMWKIRDPCKMKHLLWHVLFECMAMAKSLTYKHIDTNGSFLRCDDPVGLINHFLFECSSTLQVWNLSDYPFCLGCFLSILIYQNINLLFWKRKEVVLLKPQFDIFPWIIWYIWKVNNNKLFNKKNTSPINTIYKICFFFNKISEESKS